MKTKSSYHRSTNTYKFQTFAERLSNINIDVIRKGGRIEHQPENADSFFAAGLAKWADLNCTQDFGNFTAEISGQVDSFAQLVHHEAEIIAALKNHLQKRGSLAHQPLLDLLVQLARDLQTDFYPHFEEFFHIIVSLLNTQDTELLENAFRAFGFLFKFLWRYLVRDIKEVFGMYAPLLADGQKDHIRNFAAESFAFLMRKVRDQAELFDMMLSSLKDNPNQSTGLGRLFFEMIKGVQKQFHSCTVKVLPILLRKLGPGQGKEKPACVLPWQLVLETLQSALEFMAGWTSPQHSSVICQVLQHSVAAMHDMLVATGNTDEKLEISEQLNGLLVLTNQWTGHHGGYLIQQPDSYGAVVMKMLQGSALDDQCGETLLGLAATLLNTTHRDLSNDLVTKLVNSIFQSNYSQNQILSFSRQLFSMDSFEKDVLHQLLQFCHAGIGQNSSQSSHAILGTLCSLLLEKQSLITDGSGLEGKDQYIIDFSLHVYKSRSRGRKGAKHMDSFPVYLLSLLEFTSDLCCQDNVIATLWAALVCLPSTRPLDKAKAHPKLKSLLATLWDVAKRQEDDDVRETLLYLASQTVCALLQCCHGDEASSLIQADFIWDVLKAYPTSVHALLMGDLYISQLARDGDDSALTVDNLNSIFPALQANLSSPYKKVRMLTLRILSQFPVKLAAAGGQPAHRHVGVFQLCLEAESVSASVEEYREKQKRLQRLSYDAVQPNVPTGQYHEVALRYLIGSLYVNFQLLWQPIMELIKTHAYGMEKKQFWAVYTHHLHSLATILESPINKPSASDITLDDSQDVWHPDSHSLMDLFSHVRREAMGDGDRADHWNVRQLMWRAMVLFAERAEARSRDLVPLIFRFMEKEYYPSNVNNAPSQDIRTKSEIEEDGEDPAEEDETWEDVLDESQEGDNEMEKVKTPRRGTNKNKRQKSKGSVYRALVTYLQLFSHFRDPKSMYKEPQLRLLYLDLLSSTFPDIQRVVLACLKTYSYPYLTPYGDNLSALMDDKKFRETLVQFSIDETDGVVATNHREGLMPILLRILYGKMMSKTGTGTQGKSGGAVRRSTILRFIAGSTSDEMAVFLDLVLAPCKFMIKDDCRSMTADFLESLSPSAVIPLKKQQSMLDTLSVVLSKLGHHVAPFAPMILHLVTSLLASYARLLDQRDQLQTYAVGQLKKLRQLALLRLVEFFGIFENQPLSANEIDCIFEAAVWPQLSTLANECLASPTPLLKLILVWSKNSRFHPLLGKHHPSDLSSSALPNVTALLAAPTVSASVVAMVMEIVEQLLLGEGAEQEVDDLEVSDLVEIPLDGQQFEEPPSLGTRLLFPYVPAVLQYLSSSVSRSAQRKEDSRKLPMKDLNILSKISLYISDPEQSSVLVGVLLPFLRRTNDKHEMTELDILHTIRNVIKLCKDPCDFLGTLSRLFYRLTFRQSRDALCEIFAALGEREPSVMDVARLMRQLNTWDRKHVDEPDYAHRLKGFRKANERLAAMATIDVTFVTPIVYHCFHMILKVEDMSMRDNSAHFLKTLLLKLSEGESGSECFNAVVIHKYAPAIRDALRLKSENARHEMIGLLSDIVRLFPGHPQFQSMTCLHDADIERDFFENICHIQHHRRMRALRYLSRQAKEGALDHSALYHFLLPMATALIFDPAFAAKSPDVVLEAIAAVGAVAGRLPWRWYYLLLQQYLRLVLRSIDQQKTAVRLVVAVLDNFHFDLSLSEGVESVLVGKTGARAIQASSEGVKDEGKVAEKESSQEKEEDADEDDDDNKDADEDEEEDDAVIKDEEEDADKTEKGQDAVALATRIHRIIVASILPKLHKTLTKKAKSDEHHKKARFGLAEDAEVLRVPVALAMVKLLQALPRRSLHQHLPGVLLKVCQVLRSRAQDLRDIGRDVLVKILASLGTTYFSFILKELRHVLIRGYQLHVLSFTLHSLIHSVMPRLKSGDLDASLGAMIEVIHKELFGDVGDEKEVEGIVGKLMEARSIKGYDCYEMIAKVVGQGSLTKFLLPLKQILETSHSHKVVRKASDVLKHVTMGLLANQGLPADAMLIYVHGLTTETVPLLATNQSVKSQAKAKLDPRAGPGSCYLLPATPQRGGVTPHVSKQTNLHLMVEFGLQLLHMNLKRSKLSPSNIQHLQMLDPFIQILMDALASKHTKVTVTALRCVTWLMRYPLPSVAKHASALAKLLFRILQSHATAGGAKGANFDLVVCCFKAVTVLVRDVTQHKITEKQLQVLLGYAEEDMHDHTRQATAFGLLKAILSRKLIVPEMHDVMKKVAQLSITSESPSVRLQCRQVFSSFLLDYPLGKELKRHLEFYVCQLNFDLETGRESTLEMLATMFSSFPQKTLETYAGMFFIPMATRLLNEESVKCRKITALAIKSLLQKVGLDKRDELFAMTTHWLDDVKSAHRRLASQLLGIFVDAEEEGFQRRLDGVLPRIASLIQADGPTEEGISEPRDASEAVSLEVRHADHVLFNSLTALSKMLKHCSLLGSKVYTATMNGIWASIQSHLVHPHTWVRLVSAQLFGDLFASKQPDHVASIISTPSHSTTRSPAPAASLPKKAGGKRSKRRKVTNNDGGEDDDKGRGGDAGEEGGEKEYLQSGGRETLRALLLAFCSQLQSPVLDKDLGDQVVRNLVFLGKVIHRLHPSEVADGPEKRNGKNVDDSEESDTAADTIAPTAAAEREPRHRSDHEQVGLSWLISKLCRLAAMEAARTPKQTLKRTCVVKWLAAVSLDLGGPTLCQHLTKMLKPMCREIGDQKSHTDTDLRVLCQEVLDLIKGLVGLEDFSSAYANVQRTITKTRIERKHKRALQAVADPVLTARRKEKKHQNKKVAKKRRIQQMRPTYQAGKKVKLSDGT